MDNKRNQRPNRWICENADELSEVLMHPSGKRKLHLKYRKQCCVYSAATESRCTAPTTILSSRGSMGSGAAYPTNGSVKCGRASQMEKAARNR
ncbi:MAG TPA: hypothetical protein VEG44_04800 [Candidatus Acidoferrales bacterium]|nr:hypothetical protein [Candidatus Acidoferrales bacterium]